MMPASWLRCRGNTGKPLLAAERGVRRASTGSARMCPELVEGLIGVALPVMHRSVHELIDRKIGRLIGIAGSELLIQLNAKARFVAWMQTPFGESVRVWGGLVGQREMW